MTHQIHGTCVKLSGVGVLLRGPSGSGKSDLALRLIDDGASLIADDRVDLEVLDGALIGRAPGNIAGMIEVRGMGIMRVPSTAYTTIDLVIDLVDEETIERMPEPMVCSLLEVEMPLMRLVAEAASAPARVRLAVAAAQQPIALVAAL
jgi:serine kinase of HPr protein (carbohydrate metabolism regulator)